MKKQYDIVYGTDEAEVTLLVDTEKYTDEQAKLTLEFFTWDYDKEANPVDEVIKKIAIECIEVATANNYNTYGVKDEFNNKEGFPKLDGSIGLTLLHIQEYNFNEDWLTIEIKEIKS